MAGKTGTRPKPSAQKKLEGNPGRRPLPENEWEPDADSPPKPEDLGEMAERVWDDLVVRLDPVLTSVDGMGLEMVCREYEGWREALKTHDRQEADRAFKRVRSMLLEYGLTPAARAKVQPVKAPRGKNPLKAFLDDGGAGDKTN
jgi:phage terminase small subunit